MSSSLFIAIVEYTLISILLFQDTVSASPIFWTPVANDTGFPRIVSREEWEARQPVATEPLLVSPTPYVVIHHGGIPKYCHDQKACSAIVRSYQDFHMDDRGWFDIGYSFLIGEDGNAYEGRGWNYIGAHAPGYNRQSIGICVMGDFSDFLPNTSALKTLNSLIDYGVSLGKISKNYNVIGHRQARDTLCPGEEFYKYVQKHPRWTANPVANYSMIVTTEAAAVVNENVVESSGET